MAQPKVTGCICYSRSFEEIREYAHEHDLSTVEGLQNHDFCSNNCGLCVPYVELTLETGQTEFAPGEPHRKQNG